ncbi:MAG TPA: porin [Hyphomicrobiales bacterium]
MKMTSRFALAAAAGLLLGAAMTPAKAADLGGGCCADLEERVAELEATTARKGNRVVSLQVYGQVNKALLIFDDGVDSDAFVVDNDASGSRIGFTGSAKFKPGWSAGYLMELDIQDSASDKVTQDNDEGIENEIAIRYNYVYIESETLGRISLGQASTATDGVNEVVLGNSLKNSDLHHGSSLEIQGLGLQLKEIAANLDGGRDDVVRYDSPSIYGFIVSASWGDNDYADVALRFKKEWNSIRVAAAIGYQWDSSNDSSPDDDFETLSGSVSVMHVPTGIYGAFAAGNREVEGTEEDATFWYAQLGIEKKFLPYGSTTIYADYGQYDDFAANLGLAESSEATRWGLGIVQKIDSAAMELYAQATFWDTEADFGEGTVDGEDLTTVMIGSRIKF